MLVVSMTNCAFLQKYNTDTFLFVWNSKLTKLSHKVSQVSQIPQSVQIIELLLCCTLYTIFLNRRVKEMDNSECLTTQRDVSFREACSGAVWSFAVKALSLRLCLEATQIAFSPVFTADDCRVEKRQGLEKNQ